MSPNQVRLQRINDGVRCWTIDIRYPIPSKKNRLRPRAAGARGRKYFYDSETRAAVDAVALIARHAWRGQPAIEHPEMEVWIWCTNPRQDRDGILTTVLDGQVAGGVLFNDSIRWFNGRVTVHPAEIVPNARWARVVVMLSKVLEGDTPRA